jgi:hypothetical protein
MGERRAIYYVGHGPHAEQVAAAIGLLMEGKYKGEKLSVEKFRIATDVTREELAAFLEDSGRPGSKRWRRRFRSRGSSFFLKRRMLRYGVGLMLGRICWVSGVIQSLGRRKRKRRKTRWSMSCLSQNGSQMGSEMELQFEVKLQSELESELEDEGEEILDFESRMSPDLE